jgi:hypothetical protein
MNCILRYKGDNLFDLKKMTALLEGHHAVLLDGSLLSGKALVKLEEPDMKNIQSELGGEWEMYPEKRYQVPPVRKKIRKLL